MGFDKNTVIGFILIFGLLYVWTVINRPSPEELAARQQQDSLARVEQLAEVENSPQESTKSLEARQQKPAVPDSVRAAYAAQKLGAFGPASTGTEQEFTLENDLMTVTISNKGGHIKEVRLKDYEKVTLDDARQEQKNPLALLEDEKNVFEYILPVASAAGGIVRTSDLYFEVDQSGSSLHLVARGDDGLTFEQHYRVNPDSYKIDYDINVKGIDSHFAPNSDALQLRWINYLDRIELNYNYEKYYSTVYFKETDDDPSYCSCRGDDKEEFPSKKLKWVSHSNQFFNTTLIAQESFTDAVLETQMLDENDDDMKVLTSQLSIPLRGGDSERISMAMYTGPNDFERLSAYEMEMQDIIPFGRSVFGTINRWIVRPMFNFLSGLVSSKGLVILLLTLIVKVLLYPLTYKMLYSQAKMSALKPALAPLKEKFKDDQQKMQMESMKIYREYGVSPLGGCLPMVAQMPIWFALYRFFPASIEFRQAGFLWATDLSSYEVFTYLPFEIPFYGAHVSLFTILWAGTTVMYTYYNTRHMDMASINPMMKYMQYLMPVFFLFFFNSYASGLTLYLFYSNVLNILQTIGTKKFIFNEEKIREELRANKAKPKKKGGFQERLEKAMKEQQRIAAERETAKKRKK